MLIDYSPIADVIISKVGEISRKTGLSRQLIRRRLREGRPFGTDEALAIMTICRLDKHAFTDCVDRDALRDVLKHNNRSAISAEIAAKKYAHLVSEELKQIARLAGVTFSHLLTYDKPIPPSRHKKRGRPPKNRKWARKPKGAIMRAKGNEEKYKR